MKTGKFGNCDLCGGPLDGGFTSSRSDKYGESRFHYSGVCSTRYDIITQPLSEDLAYMREQLAMMRDRVGEQDDLHDVVEHANARARRWMERYDKLAAKLAGMEGDNHVE